MLDAVELPVIVRTRGHRLVGIWHSGSPMAVLLNALRSLAVKRAWGTGKIEARPIAFIGPDSIPARQAMIAASKQNRAFNFAQITYANQGTENTGWVTDEDAADLRNRIVKGLEPRFGAQLRS
mgnify:CR=1 FL=1